jgi:type II restriction enzyme
LSDTAVRKGWIGCNILLGNIPEPGIIRVIENETALPKAHVRSVWDRMLFLKEDRTAEARTWTVETLRLIDRLPRTEFSLAELYRAEPELKKLFPRNGHIKAKLRQQAQRLRDTGYLKSAGKGVYRVAR